MEIRRTANAGVLLKLDGIRILLDGFCDGIGPYLATPASVREELLNDVPDLLAFTHNHPDHFSEALVSQYRKQTLRPILGPENLPFGTTSKGVAVGGVSIQPVKSRHIGKEYLHVPHVSYAVMGSKTVWFLGDATPSQWLDTKERADVAIVPFAYALSKSAWKMTCGLADRVVLVHMPLRENDPDGLWPQVENVVRNANPGKLYIPAIGETVVLA